MIARMEGTVNGSPIILYHVRGNLWQATVPPDIRGTYVVDMTAYDEAGNMAYVTKMLFTVDPHTLCVHLEPYPYMAEVLPGNYWAELVSPPLCPNGGAR